MKNENNNKKTTVINKKMIICVINIILFIILTILVFTKVTEPIDSAVESFILGIRHNHLTNIMRIFTNISSSYSLIVITFLIILIAIIRNKRLPINTIVNLICSYLTSYIFKIILRRPRPTGEFLTNAGGFSYPSGHTMVSFAFFTFVAISAYEKINNKLIKVLIRIFTPILILIIGFSRIYLGVHYTTDIIGGYLLGTAYLMIFLTIREKNKKKKKRK